MTSGELGRPLHVLIVDDSAVMRQIMAGLLGKSPGFSVDTASDPVIAMERMRNRRPDVIVLDLEMPRMDGMTFLRKLMKEDPIPVVICSGHVAQGAHHAVEALAEGAVDLIAKPQLGLRDFLEETADTIVETIRGAAHAQLFRRALRGQTPAQRPASIRAAKRFSVRPSGDYVVALGASTGGTDALRDVLEALPSSCPPIVIVQHMPELFTATFAKHLNRTCEIEVREAVHGDGLEVGRALIAPGNHHMRLQRVNGRLRVDVSSGPLVNRHRPSVDVLFKSVAQNTGKQAVGIIMTGMGGDGADGLLEMRRAGARTVAQDQASCAVFGMPKVAIACGAARDVMPLDQIATAILEGP